MSSVRPDINIHPNSHPGNALQRKEYDVVVIGAGPAGMTACFRLAQGGLSVLLVESELVGGECVYWACVPSKALLRASETVQDMKAVKGARERLELLTQKYGVPAKPEVEVDGVWARRDTFSRDWNDESTIKGVRDAGVDVAHGFGQVTGAKQVQIKDWHSGEVVQVEAKQAVVIATGSAPKIPPIDGLEQSHYWIPREAVSAREVPEHLIILGAGAVGTEMATFYNQIGSKVTLIGHKVLSKMAPKAGNMVRDSLIQAGVDVKLGLDVKQVHRDGKFVEVKLSDGSVVKGTEILVATGRSARTSGMTLESVGAPSDGDWIQVDDSMRATSVPEGWLYAISDTNGRAMMTHIGKYQAGLAANSIIAKVKGAYQKGGSPQAVDKLMAQPPEFAIAQCVFTDPQVAASGLTVKQARAKGMKVRTVSVEMSGPGAMLHADGYQGWAQWVIDDKKRLVGATFVGRDAVDLLHASTVAILGWMRVDHLWHAIPPFPTMSEIYTTLAEAAEMQKFDDEN